MKKKRKKRRKNRKIRMILNCGTRVTSNGGHFVFLCAGVRAHDEKKIQTKERKKKKKEEEERINKTSQFLRTLAILRHDHKG